MTLAAAKQKLHNYIDNADSKKVKAILTLLETETVPESELSETEWKELDGRWEEYLSGKTKSYTLEESMAHIRNHIENKRKNRV